MKSAQTLSRAVLMAGAILFYCQLQGCGSKEAAGAAGAKATALAALQGTWSGSCVDEGNSRRWTLAISGDTTTLTETSYLSNDCTGTGTVLTTIIDTITDAGASLSFPAGARTLDFDGDPLYSIFKVEGNQLYFGMSSPGHDGSTPERRHNTWREPAWIKQ